VDFEVFYLGHFKNYHNLFTTHPCQALVATDTLIAMKLGYHVNCN